MSRCTEDAAELDLAIDTMLREPRRPVVVDEPGLLATGRLLAEVLPRFHPRFTFEERLAQRLLAGGQNEPGPRPSERATPPDPVPLHAGHVVGDEPGSMARRRCGWMAGGAIASGISLAIPIAGAALVAWRRARASEGIL